MIYSMAINAGSSFFNYNICESLILNFFKLLTICKTRVIFRMYVNVCDLSKMDVVLRITVIATKF
jgi:hypothetical protein